jgi:hypothetical protein
MLGHHTCGVDRAVGIDMLQGLFVMVLVHRTVIAMVMRIVLQVENEMSDAFAMIVCKGRGRRYERLPKDSCDEQENSRRVAHAGNLTETRRSVEPTEDSRGAQMLLIVTKYAVTAFVVVLVSELAKRSDKIGALVASLPMVTVLVMIWLYMENQGTEKVARHAYYTFWYVRKRSAIAPCC